MVEGQAEGQACAEPGARTTIGASGIQLVSTIRILRTWGEFILNKEHLRRNIDRISYSNNNNNNIFPNQYNKHTADIELN